MSLLSAELPATCNALGYFDEKNNKYYSEPNTIETVKDLIRYLRRDDEVFSVRRQLGEIKVLQTDLLPLLKNYWEDKELFDILLRLLVNLTTPALVLWNEVIPLEKAARNYYLQIEDHLQSYKQSFTDESVWAVISTRLSNILEMDYMDRGDENSLIIERILILIRNVLYVPIDYNVEKRPDNDPGIHDQVLWALHQSGMFDIILFITSSVNEQAYYMHILEILSFMMRDQTASKLARTTLPRSQTEKLRDESELLAIRHKETNQKLKKLKKFNGTRHSRFGGTYVVKSLKSIGDNELIYHKPLQKIDELNFDTDKIKTRTPKNRLPIQETVSERRSALGIRLFLKEFCVEFLNGAYNTLMFYVKNNLARAKQQTHDESYYLWTMRFFMEFNRFYKFEIKFISETLSVQSFHFVQKQIENYFDLLQTNKKKAKLWSKRLHLALLAYKELLQSLDVMHKDESNQEAAKIIMSNIFYVVEYRELILTLLITFDELKMSQLYLKDLLETQHIFVKMLETFCIKNNVIVQKRQIQRRKPKPKPMKQFKPDEEWDKISLEISTILEETSDFPKSVPFDASLDLPIDQQKSLAMTRIQQKLRENDYENAIGLLRAAREVWPENNCFGYDGMDKSEEFLAIRDIFLANLGNEVIEEPIFDDYDEEEEEEPRILECDFKFEDFTKRLANPKIVQACALALKHFDKNQMSTNNCIVKLLHRIAFDCKMYVMIFQVSIFRIFQRIYEYKELPEYKELIRFANYITRQFINVTETNDKVYIEALFWKTNRECYDIEQGYGSYQEKSSALNKIWTDQEEDEIRRLFMEHQQSQLEDDVVDWITNNLIDNTKSRRMVLKKLKQLYLLTDYKAQKKTDWTIQEEIQLRDLFDAFKNAIDPLDCIISRLEVKRSKNKIIDKLLEMGVIQDRKELRKKRTKKMTSSQNQDHFSDSDSGSDRVQVKKTIKIASKSEMIKLVKRIIELDMREALMWIKESFFDAVEDLDNSEDIPLVPIMEFSINAMENDDFLKMLHAFGICEPFNEQETYWRIPASTKVETLRMYCELIQMALDNNLEDIEEIEEVGNVENDINEISSRQETDLDSRENENSNSSNGFSRKSEENDLAKKAKLKSRFLASDDESDERETKENGIRNAKEDENSNSSDVSGRAREDNDLQDRQIEESGQDTREDENSNGSDVFVRKIKTDLANKQKTKSRFLLSDDEDDIKEMENDGVNIELNEREEDVGMKRKSKNRFLESDNEGEEMDVRNVSGSDIKKSVRKRRRIILSEDED